MTDIFLHQYHFALTDASSWDPHYNSFNYISLYDTIVDYFEDVQPGTAEEKHTKELLGWWTKYATFYVEKTPHH